MPIYFIKKRIKARNPFEALVREKEAEIRDCWVDVEEEDDEELVEVPGFEYCISNKNKMGKCKPKPKKK